MKKIQDTFPTPDLGMIAYLRFMGIHPLFSKNEDRKVVCHFLNDDRLSNAISLWVKDSPCPVRSYYDALKSTKSDIMRKSRASETFRQ